MKDKHSPNSSFNWLDTLAMEIMFTGMFLKVFGVNFGAFSVKKGSKNNGFRIYTS